MKTSPPKKLLSPALARQRVSDVRSLFGKPAAIPRTVADFAWIGWKARDIEREATQAIDRLRRDVASIISLSGPERSFPSVIIAYDTAWSRFADVQNHILVIENFFMDKAARETALRMQKILDTESRKITTDPKLYAVMRPLLEQKSDNPLDERLRVNYKTFFRLMGFELSAPDRKRLQSLLGTELRLGLDFGNAINTNQFTLWLHPTRDTDGLSDAFLARLPRDKRGYYGVQTRSMSDATTFLETCANRDLRRKFLLMQNQVGGKGNLVRLQKLRAVRDQHTKLLGYKSYFHLQTQEGTAAGSQARVKEFLSALQDWASKEASQDLAMLQASASRRGVSYALQSWDTLYEAHLVYKQAFSMDDDLVRSYFPVAKTIRNIWNLWEKVLGIRIAHDPSVPVWSPDVTAFTVSDAKGTMLGTLFVDMFPRPGKFTHVGVVFPLGRHYVEENRYHLPSALIGMNVGGGTNPTLSHYDVETFIHESGHALHTLLYQGPYGSMASFMVYADFLELPSQFAESWTADADELRKLSSHVTTGKPLPRDVADRIVAAIGYLKGWKQLRYTAMSLFDHDIHMNARGTVMQHWNRIQKKLGILPAPQGAIFPARFGHMAGGYEARYWTYAWAEQYIAQCWDAFMSDGKRSAALGRKYRKMILEMGDTVDPETLVVAFSGKPIDTKSFLRSMTRQVKAARRYLAKVR